MRNSPRRSGVYSNMVRASLFFISSIALLAQQSPRLEPLDAQLQAVWNAENQRDFAGAATAREQARSLLQRTPVDSPRFVDWVRQVRQLYQNVGRNADARSIVQDAVARTEPLGDTHPTHVVMLDLLGASWRQDGSLLKSAACLERVAAAQAALRPAATGRNMPIQIVTTAGIHFSRGNAFSVDNAFLTLADLYQQLGRPDAVAALAARIRANPQHEAASLAQFYDQYGPLDRAVEEYRRLIEESADPQIAANAAQSLSNLYARQDRYADAVASIQQAIAVAQHSEQPGGVGQSFWMRQTLADYLRNLGQIDRADAVYAGLLQESHGVEGETQALGLYAQYLSQTDRGAQGEKLLKDFLTAHSDLEPTQKSNVFFHLANLARLANDETRATDYEHAAEDLQPKPPRPLAGQPQIANDIRAAELAVVEHRPDDAYRLILQAIEKAGHAEDGQQVDWIAPQIANALAEKAPEQADRVFQSLIVAARTRSNQHLQPLVTAMQNYARFLIGQPRRPGDTAAALEQYRAILVEANGVDSATLLDPLQMRIEWEQARGEFAKAAASARELLELQESLTGSTSAAYLHSLETAAAIYEAAGDTARALPLLRQTIAIADLLAAPLDDSERSRTRMNTALALARLGQFDEAETLGEAAVKLCEPSRTPIEPLKQQLDQIRQMHKSAAK